jgi:hypothetical protein
MFPKLFYFRIGCVCVDLCGFLKYLRLNFYFVINYIFLKKHFIKLFMIIFQIINKYKKKIKSES